MGVYGSSEEKVNLVEVRDFLKENLRKDAEVYFGLTNSKFIEQVTRNWFNDNENYDGRWEIINERVRRVGKVLDMAAGCGTFVLYGLQNGYDVCGVEPEEWKREYFRRKVFASNYPVRYLDRIVAGVGEKLPFQDESFDLVTTYQTLEHVQDVSICIQEMLRVLKCGGVLYIKAPDYNCFFEPHYRVPFLPKMNKKLATRYLKLINRPILGLETLQWTTERDVVKFLKNSKHKLNIERTSLFISERRKAKIRDVLPIILRKQCIVNLLDKAYEKKVAIVDARLVGRCEKSIDLWVIKVD